VGAGERQAQAQHLLGAGLADAAGDGDDAGIRARTRGTADGFERAQRIGDAQQRAAGCAAGIGIGDDGRSRAGLNAGRDELVAVARVLQGDEHVAGLETARCRWKSR
jgi:hypothetical protein